MKAKLFILIMLSFWALKSQEIEQHGGRNTVPPTVETIVGDSVACPYEGTLLTAYPTSPRYYIEWYTYEDSTWHSGSTINVFPRFVNGEYCVGVCQVDIETGCRSELTNYTIHIFGFASLGLNGLQACPEEVIKLEAPNQGPRCLYEWYLDEDNYYKASVQNDHLASSIDLAINRLVSGGDDNYFFPVFLQRSACDVKRRDTVWIEVNHPAEFTINVGDAVCRHDALFFNAEGTGDDTYLWEIPGRMRREGNNISHTFNWSGIDTIEVSARSGATCSYGEPKIHIVNVIQAPSVNISLRDDNYLVAVASNCDNPLEYKWFKDEEWLGSGSEIYVDDVANIEDYCCEVLCEEPEYELKCSARNCYRVICVDTADTTSVHIEDLDPYCGRGIFSIEPVYSNSEIEWHVYPTIMRMDDSGRRRVEIDFSRAGVHTVTAIEKKYDGQCMRHTITCTIRYAPRFTLLHICPGNISITDSSSYYNTSLDDIEISFGGEQVSISERDGHWITSMPQEITSKTTFAFGCEVSIIDSETGDFNSCSASTNLITLYPKGQLLSYHIPQRACDKVPFPLYATGRNIEKYTWRFVDNSTYSSDSIDHTVTLGSTQAATSGYSIQLTATDSNGCPFIRTEDVDVASNPINGTVRQMTDNPYPCPESYCQLKFLPNSDNFDSWTYKWLSGGDSDTLPTYNTLVQDNHIVRVMEPEYGCVSEIGGKSIFRVAPDARILAKSVYCPEDEVRLLAIPGLDYTYQWTLGGHNMSAVDTVQNPVGTLAISGCTPMRDYYDTLVVGNSQGCYDTAYHSFKVVYTSPSPQVRIEGDMQPMEKPTPNADCNTRTIRVRSAKENKENTNLKIIYHENKSK